jgi:small subunit ribosomal protein S6
MNDMNEENQLYQLSCHLSPLMDQSQLNQAIEDMRELITANDGLILVQEELSVDNIKRKKLAYPIKKYEESFYLTFNFLTQDISQINSKLNLDKNVIRHMIVAKQKPNNAPKEIIDYKATKQIESLSKKEEPVEEKPVYEKEKPAYEKREKIKIEELDKKLEEILNT